MGCQSRAEWGSAARWSISTRDLTSEGLLAVQTVVQRDWDQVTKTGGFKAVWQPLACKGAIE